MSKEEFDAKYKGEWDYAEILADYPVDEETTNMEADDEKVEINHDMMAHLANSSSEESTMFDDAMEIHDNEGEQALAQHLGMSDDEFNQELNEYCMARGLHADDDREEAIQGMVEELIDHREQMSSMRNAPQAQEESAETCDSCGKPVQLCGCDDHQHESIERLRQLAGI